MIMQDVAEKKVGSNSVAAARAIKKAKADLISTLLRRRRKFLVQSMPIDSIIWVAHS